MNDSHNEARQLLMRFAKVKRCDILSSLASISVSIKPGNQVRLFWPIEHWCQRFVAKQFLCKVNSVPVRFSGSALHKV